MSRSGQKSKNFNRVVTCSLSLDGFPDGDRDEFDDAGGTAVYFEDRILIFNLTADIYTWMLV